MVSFILSFTVFLSSACGLIIEIVAGRLIAPVFGMSLYTWTSIIAVVLAGFSVGHWIGGRMTLGTTSKRKQLQKISIALFLSSGSSLLILPMLNLIPNFVLSIQMSLITAIMLVSMSLFFLPSLFVGIVSPLATKLAIDIADNSDSGMVIGRMYALGTVGAIFGALMAGYLLIATLGSRSTVLLIASLYFAQGCLFAIIQGRGGNKLLLSATLLCIGLASITYFTSSFRSQCYSESSYFCIQINSANKWSDDVRLMALDHLVHSINDKKTPELLHSPYVHFVDEYVEQRLGQEAISAFFIGGGGFSLPRAWLEKYQGRAQLTIAEIDPDVTRVAREMLWFDDQGANTNIIHDDARVALNSIESSKKFDLIFGDAFHDISIPAHLVTREFNELVASRLDENGFYVVNVVDNPTKPAFLLSFVKTLRQSFSETEIWFEPNQVGRTTFIVVAAKTSFVDNFLTAKNGFERSWWRWPNRKLEKALVLHSIPILTDDLAPVERLMSGMVLAGSH